MTVRISLNSPVVVRFPAKTSSGSLTMIKDNNHKVAVLLSNFKELQQVKDFFSYAGEKSKDAFGVVKG
jgi:hypothetical protein